MQIFLELAVFTLLWTRSSLVYQHVHNRIALAISPRLAGGALDYLEWAQCPLCSGAWFAAVLGLAHWTFHGALLAYLGTVVLIAVYDALIAAAGE